MPTLHVVFDIDGVLVLNAKHETSYSKETMKFFSSHNSILNLTRNNRSSEIYYLLPGVLELMKLLFSLPELRVAFFSAGSEDRNNRLIKQLLIRALGEEHYERVAPDLTILSRRKVTSRQEISPLILQNQLDTYGLRSLNLYKKDLTKALKKEHELTSTIFIEDNPDVIYGGQEKNLLYCNSACPSDYELLNQSAAASARCLRFFTSCFGYTQCESAEDELFRAVNSIYYITGLIIECIEKNERGTMLDDLFQLQFKTNGHARRFTPRFEEALKIQHYYDQGLSHLRTLNPHLSFNTPSYYLSRTAKTYEEPSDGEDASLLNLVEM